MALLAIFLGYGYIHGSFSNPRPYSLLASSHVQDTKDNHRVESRLWQDPFEPFEPATNLDESPPDLSQARGSEDTNDVRELLWGDIAQRAGNSNCPVAILAVTLPGGSYAEDKEVRLRLRYA